MTLVLVDMALIATALAAADELVDDPTAVSLILMSCDVVNEFAETRSELI